MNSLFGVLMAAALSTLSARAASTNTWVGNTDANWGTSANWTFSSGAGPVASGDSLVFGAAGSSGLALNNNLSGLTINKLTFNSGASSFTFGGNNITLGTGGIDAGALTSGVQTFAFTNVIGTGVQRWIVGSGATLAFGKLSAGAGVADTYGPNGAIVRMSNTGTKTTTSADGWGWRSGAVAGTGLLGPGMVIDNGNNTYDWASAGNSGGPIVAATYTTAASSDAHNVKVTGNTTVTPNASWASLLVQGATLTHNGANIYLDTGIILQSGGVINGSGPLKANNDGLYIHVPDSGTISASIQNNGANAKLLYKTGPGTLTLSGANTYTGNTVVYEGALVQSTAATGAGGYLVKDGATLGVSGSGTLRMSSLALGNSAFNLPTANTTAAAITNTGALTLAGTVTVNVGGLILPVGQYPLIASASISGTGGFAVGSLPLGNGANIITNGNTIVLNVTTSQLPTFLWTGLNNNSWDFSTANNWATNGGSVLYSDNQLVRFDDSSAQTNVNIATSVAPQSLVVSNSARRYTFSGSAIAGSTSLTKSGTGTLVLANVNTYTGGTVISNGTLQLGDGLGNYGSVAGNITANGGLTFANTANETYAGVISGSGTLVKSGANELTLSGANNFTGSTTVSNGTLVVTKAQSLGANIAVRDGATLSAIASADATYLSPPTLTVGNSSGATLQFGVVGTNNPILTPGTVTLNGTTTVKISWAPYLKDVNFPLFTGYTSGTLVLGSEPKGWHGRLVVNAGTVSYVVTNFDFVHPGALHTQADFDRMKAKVQAGAQPWMDGWNILTNMSSAQLNYPTHPQAVLQRGNGGGSCLPADNYQFAFYDTAAAYQLALRWKVSGDTNYANAAINFLNQWAAICTNLCGDPNIQLLEIYGYQFAVAGEIMRSYSGWAPADVQKFQNWMLNLWYPMASAFLRAHMGSCSTHHWANWDQASMNAVMAIGILCDDTNIYNEALTYFKQGIGNGNIEQTVYYMHPGYFGQGQEIGRDQGHSGMNIAMAGVFCTMAYNQGDDLFAYQNNRVLAMCEYFAKFNIGQDVPYLPYKNCDAALQTNIGGSSRGDNRPTWDLIYNHYVNLKGIAAPWSEQYAARNRPDGGGLYYGSTSGAFDQLGFTTLTCSRDPIAVGQNPSGLTAALNGPQQVQLNWWGTAYATNYFVKRATASGGPYTTIATITTNLLTYTDSTVTSGVTYYYTVSALTPTGESGNGNEAVVSVQPQLIAYYKFNESSGASAADASGNGRTATLNGATWTTGYSSNAVNLNGGSQYVTLPNGITTNLADFTVATWVYLNGAQGYWSRIFDFGWATSAVWGSTYYSWPMRYMFLAPASGNMRFAITLGTSEGEQHVDGNQPMPVNGWHHVAITLAGNTGTMYLDGVQIGTGIITITPAQLGSLNSNFIGKSQWNDPYLNGKVDDFRIYSGALSAGEVATFVTPLAAPANVIATAGNGQIALNWSAATNASSYNILRSLTSGGPYTQITNVTSTSFTDTGVVNGTTYYYVVTAVNAVAESGNSTQASATPQPPAPATPTGLIAIGGNAQVALSWNASSGAASYNVKRATVSGGPYSTITNVTSTSFTDLGVVNGTTYYYVVSALNGGGESADSAQVSATPQVSVPPVPTGLAATAGNQQASLSWSASSGATSYNVKRSLTSGSGYTTVTNVTGTSVVDSGLSNGTTYYYVVSALNAGGESANSTEVSVTPSDLLAHWKFNETSGTAAADASGSGYNGTLQNGATWIAGVSSNAVDMNGASQYVSLPSGVVSTLNDFSIATFVKVDTNAMWARVFDFGSGTGTYMFLAPASGGNSVRYAITTGSAAGEQQLNSATVLSPGVWHHLAVTLSGTTGVLYIDGTAVATNSAMTLNPSGLGSTTQNYIGKSQWNDPYLNGSVDEFRIYGRALSAGEVSTLAAAKLPSPWTTSDVGAVAATGGADNVSGTFTVQGAGANIGGAADAFRFVYQSSSGDCSNTIRVTSVPATGANAKAGVMIRETLSAGSLEAGIWVTPTNGIIFTSRNSTGGSTSTSTAAGLTAPYWVRIVRVGNSFSAYHSAAGTTWTKLGNSKNISMSSSAYIGMGVCSGVSNVLNTSTMTNAVTVP